MRNILEKIHEVLASGPPWVWVVLSELINKIKRTQGHNHGVRYVGKMNYER